MNQKTKVINLFAGPGTGKSTTAAGLFNLMKLGGYRCELVTEYAKTLTYEDRMTTLQNQLYIFAKQFHKMQILVEQVNWIITDSPLLLSLVYGRKEMEQLSTFAPYVCEVNTLFDNYNFYLYRVKEYQPYGRIQTEEKAREIDLEIRSMLGRQNQKLLFIDADPDAPTRIINSLEGYKGNAHLGY